MTAEAERMLKVGLAMMQPWAWSLIWPPPPPDWIDRETGEVTMASAGHRPAILWRAGKTATINPNGIALGLDIGPVFDRAIEEKRVTMQKNDRLVMYTDGLLSAENDAGETYGEERMAHLERFLVLNSIDNKWKEHLYVMDALRSGIGLRSYAQIDSKNEYKREGLGVSRNCCSTSPMRSPATHCGSRFAAMEPGQCWRSPQRGGWDQLREKRWDPWGMWR